MRTAPARAKYPQKPLWTLYPLSENRWGGIVTPNIYPAKIQNLNIMSNRTSKIPAPRVAGSHSRISARHGKTNFLSAFALAAWFVLAVAVADAQAADKKKIILIAGPASHGSGQHEFSGGSRLLAEALNASGLPVEAVVNYNGWPKDISIFDGAAAVVPTPP